MGRLAERNRLPTVYGLGYLCVAQRHSKVRMHATDDAFNDGSLPLGATISSRLMAHNPDSPIFALAVLAITRVLPFPHYPLSKLG